MRSNIIWIVNHIVVVSSNNSLQASSWSEEELCWPLPWINVGSGLLGIRLGNSLCTIGTNVQRTTMPSLKPQHVRPQLFLQAMSMITTSTTSTCTITTSTCMVTTPSNQAIKTITKLGFTVWTRLNQSGCSHWGGMWTTFGRASGGSSLEASLGSCSRMCGTSWIAFCFWSENVSAISVGAQWMPTHWRSIGFTNLDTQIMICIQHGGTTQTAQADHRHSGWKYQHNPRLCCKDPTETMLWNSTTTHNVICWECLTSTALTMCDVQPHRWDLTWMDHWHSSDFLVVYQRRCRGWMRFLTSELLNHWAINTVVCSMMHWATRVLCERCWALRRSPNALAIGMKLTYLGFPSDSRIKIALGRLWPTINNSMCWPNVVHRFAWMHLSSVYHWLIWCAVCRLRDLKHEMQYN